MNTYRVQLFARARDLAGQGTWDVSLPEGATVEGLRRTLLNECPGLAPVRSTLLFAVNESYAAPGQVLMPGDRVACFPPVSGG